MDKLPKDFPLGAAMYWRINEVCGIPHQPESFERIWKVWGLREGAGDVLNKHFVVAERPLEGVGNLGSGLRICFMLPLKYKATVAALLAGELQDDQPVAA